MRNFARFETHIPVDLVMRNSEFPEREFITDMSYGGASLESDVDIPEGETVNLSVPDLEDKISVVGEVKWHRDCDDHYDIGIEFIHRDQDLSCELVSQVYYIEQYAAGEVERGRMLDFEQAAMEWLATI